MSVPGTQLFVQNVYIGEGVCVRPDLAESCLCQPAHKRPARDQPSRNGTSPAPRWLDFPHHDQVGSITRTLGLSTGEFYRTTTTVPPHVGLISRMTTRLARLLAHLAGRWRVFPHHDHSPAPRWLVFPHDDQAGSITRTLG
jgi:hypothetical protein